MKNLISNLPGLRIWLRWFKSIGHKIRNKRLKLGYNVALNNVTLETDVSIGENCNLLRVEVGRFTYLAGNCFFRDVKIGRFCAIAPNVKMGLGFHPTNLVSIHPAFYSTELQTAQNFATKNEIEDHKSGKVGNDVWIGANVVILDGISIGNGAVIAAGAVVNKDVLPYEIVGGVPAKHIKFRFPEAKIADLERIQWWNWEIEKIRSNKELFLNINEFIASQKIRK